MAFFIVGIGASAGGLDAVTELLGALPAATGMAYIVVQHLDPTHESLLSELLTRKTAVPVSVAVHGELVRPNRVYVIPPNATLTVVDGHITLKQRPSAPERSLPVDILFKSLAVGYAENAIGVVLSGADSDGSLGVREIKHAGGFTFAQSPKSARFPNMPQHAIDTGCVDLVLRPNEIADQLLRLRQGIAPSQTSESGSTTALDVRTNGDEARLRQLFRRLQSVHGVDFTHYKRTTIQRRLERRLTLRRIESLEEYSDVIASDPNELFALYQDFLIRVTEFFRDPQSFEALHDYILPALCNDRSPGEALRIWVPGCATGEEAYSVAIVVLEYLGDRLPTSRIQIFGTDVSEASLEKARAGVYHSNVLLEVSAERLQRFFTRQDDDAYRIAKEVRDLCLFARQDVTRDPPFSRLDLISCRNLLIYLDDVAQHRVLRTFHFALRPQGMLMFGPAESVGQSSELFGLVDKHARVFRRIPNTGGEAIEHRAGVSHFPVLDPAEHTARLRAQGESLPREADRLLLARFAPACLLVNQALTILQFRGNTGPYLEPAGGPPSFDVRRVVRPELLVQILSAIEETTTTGVPSRRDVRLDDAREIGLDVLPLTASVTPEAFLILFDDGSRPVRARSQTAAGATLPESEKDRRLAQLERELDGYRDYVRATIEEQGAIQEELKSAHEEMLSANEEFQSTNEELETSKEELQSANEELTTTIDELRSRNQELTVINAELAHLRGVSDQARSYADIIINTVRAPLAVLDRAHRILRVNPAFTADLEVRREDVEGRLLHEVDDGRWNVPELRQRLAEVLSGGQPMEDLEITVDLGRRGRRVISLTARMIPGDAERTELLLLVFDDVTSRANLTAMLLARDEKKDDFIAMLSHELRHPMTPIAHAVYLLRLGNPDPNTVELLETIDTQTQRLVRFMDELLDVNRVGRGLLEIRRERLDLVAVVRGAIRAMHPLIDKRQHLLTTALPAAPMFVDGDSDRLHQVVNNLIENAVKFTDPGGQITVTLEQRDDEAVLRVRDNGIGIEPANLARVFEPFTRAHGTLTGDRSGLGLGLSLVKRLLEMHGGRIEATSGGLGTGSEFVASLPISVSRKRSSAKSGSPPRERERERETRPLPTLRPHRVLIVDDHDEVGQSLARLVRTWGHEVAIVRDGPSALSLAETFLPECAVLDLSLPGMNGIDLARRLRQMFPRERLYMIALTGYSGAALREACLGAGFDAHLVKPGDIDLLEKLLGGDRQNPDVTPG